MNRVKLFAGLMSLLWASCCAVNRHDSCPQCGCERVTKRCRVSCETEQVPKTTYSVEYEDVCLPERRPCTGAHEAEGCIGDEFDQGARCAKIYTRTKLVKKTTEETKTKYRWSVVTDCPHCEAARAGCATLPPEPTASDAH
ncbi:hypothetical protein SH661x_002097 [Planctomicrobium sp. SH661]|uniref:hypothetical protein n=1 Tax=Planctomicrobium sp. SH661 TaxID=3448124 RepID=UPI003F5B79A8